MYDMIWGVEENGYMHVHDQLILHAFPCMYVVCTCVAGDTIQNKQKEVQLLQLVQYIVSGFE